MYVTIVFYFVLLDCSLAARLLHQKLYFCHEKIKRVEKYQSIKSESLFRLNKKWMAEEFQNNQSV